MIRRRAKNHAYVAVWTAPRGHGRGARGAEGGATTLALRRRLAARAYARTAAYDAAISTWFAGQVGEAGARSGAPRRRAASRPCATARTRTRRRRFYTFPETAPRRRHRPPAAGQGAQLQQHQRHRRGAGAGGRVRSGSQRRRARSSSTPTPAASPWARPEGGVRAGAAVRSGVGLRRHRRAEPAARPGRGAGDREDLHRGGDRARRPTRTRSRSFKRRKDLRLLVTGALPDPLAKGETFKRWRGGFLVQGRDDARLTAADLKIVTQRAPTAGRGARHAVRLHRRQARQVQRHRLRQGRPDRRHRRRPDEPARLRPHRRVRGAEAAERRACRSRWPRARPAPRRRSSRSPTA